MKVLVFPILACTLAVKLCHSYFVDIPLFEEQNRVIQMREMIEAAQVRAQNVARELTQAVTTVANTANNVVTQTVNTCTTAIGSVATAGVETAKQSLSWAKKNKGWIKGQVIAWGVNKLYSCAVSGYYASIGADPGLISDINFANGVSGYYDQR